MPDESLNVTGSAPNFKPKGRSGLNRWGGLVHEEWLPELRGDRAIRVYREMRDNEPIITAGLMIITMILRGMEWEFEVNDEKDAGSVEMKEFLEQCKEDFDGQTFDDIIDEALSMLPYGWSFMEIIYKLRQGPDAPSKAQRSKYTDGKIGWHRISLRSQDTRDRWAFDEYGDVIGMWQRTDDMAKPAFIPMAKAILFRTTKHKNNPEGKSILRGAYRPWYFKKNIEIVEGIGIERDLAGLPVLSVPVEILMPNAPPQFQTLKTELEKMVSEIKRDEREGVLLPNEDSGYKFELASGGGQRQFDTNTVIERKTREILMSMLTDFLVVGHQEVGAYNLSASKQGYFARAIEGWAESIADNFNEQAVKPLLRLNGYTDLENAPRLRPGAVNFRDVTEKIDALQKMSFGGILPNVIPPQLINTLLRELALDPIDPDEFDAERDRMRAAEDAAAQQAKLKVV